MIPRIPLGGLVRVMSASMDYFKKNYIEISGNLTFFYPKDLKETALKTEPTVKFGYQQLQKFLQLSPDPNVNFIIVQEQDWSKTPLHDTFPYGLAYISNNREISSIYLSLTLPDYYLIEDADLNRAIVSWHELGRFFFSSPNFPFPTVVPHWLKEGLLQLAVWTLMQESEFDCRPIDPVEAKLRDQTHFTILEYEPSRPIKPARYAKYQWLLLFMMRDLSRQYSDSGAGQLLADIIPVLKSASQNLNYVRTMDLLSDLLEMNVGDWLSTRWYF